MTSMTKNFSTELSWAAIVCISTAGKKAIATANLAVAIAFLPAVLNQTDNNKVEPVEMNFPEAAVKGNRGRKATSW